MELRIKEVIAKKGITITEIAEKSGIEKGNVSTYVNGRRQPTIETLEKLADAIGVPITEFFEKPLLKGDNDTIGIIRHNGTVYEINSIEDVKRCLNDIEKDQ